MDDAPQSSLSSLPTDVGDSSLTRALKGIVNPPSYTVNQRPRKVSRLAPGQLLSQVQPVYPLIAKQAGIQGEVVLAAIINRSGSIESLQVKSGHPLLAQAALDAVKQWRYRPYILNGEAVEVETQITVDFKLGR